MEKKEAIEIIKNHLPNSSYKLNKALETLIPELKEQEDEIIRKDIISFLQSKNGYMNPDEDWDFHNRWLPWLEKQGEQKEINYDTGVQQKDSALITTPKFKIGDWIIQENIGIYKIVEVCDSWYKVISYQDGIQYPIYFNEEYRFNLWTIKDAKKGDVLATKDTIFIFKNLDKTGLSLCESYCDITEDSKLGLGFDFSINETKPATKEQRELLFQKMREAGYEWEDENKQLR